MHVSDKDLDEEVYLYFKYHPVISVGAIIN